LTNDIFSKAGFLLVGLIQCLFWRPDYIFVAHVNFSGLAHIFSKWCRAKCILNIYGLEVWGHLSIDAAYGFRRVNDVISDCHFTARYVEEKGIRKSHSVHVIWDCVDLEWFSPRPDQWLNVRLKYGLPDRQNHFILLTLGRLSKDAAYKGYDRLISVFKKITLTKRNTTLIIAGKGDLVPELQKKVQEEELEDQVIFTGSVDEEDMSALYSYAHLFSLISHRDRNSGEGIPLTPLEAMSCGVPVLVGNQDGSQEAVFEGRNGFVVDPFDLKMHEKYILALMENEPLQKLMAIEARQVAEQFFSYQEFKEKHKQLMLSIQQEN
jgi:phosphatidylinositol alpha-1,6-mannosyltransferase